MFQLKAYTFIPSPKLPLARIHSDTRYFLFMYQLFLAIVIWLGIHSTLAKILKALNS